MCVWNTLQVFAGWFCVGHSFKAQPLFKKLPLPSLLACIEAKRQPEVKAQGLLRILLSIHSALDMQGLPDSSVYGGALQSPCYLTISSCSLFIPRLFGLFAACLRLLCLVYLILNAFDKCHLGGHPSSKKVPTQAKQKQACKWILH